MLTGHVKKCLQEYFEGYGVAILFYDGSQTISKMISLQLVENGAYVITYCDGVHYVLHKVNYGVEEIIICRKEKKVINIDDIECCIKPTSEIVIQE